MYWFELQDVMFIVKCLKVPPDNFNILDHISFNNSSTRSSSSNHLKFNFCCTSFSRHYFFNRISKLWNHLAHKIDISLSLPTIRLHFLWNKFVTKFDPKNTCTFHIICPCSNCHQYSYFNTLYISTWLTPCCKAHYYYKTDADCHWRPWAIRSGL